MIDFISIIVIAGLIAFPIINSRSNSMIYFDFIIGLAFGVNFNTVDFEHSEDEDKYYKQYMLQFHLGILSVTMSAIEEKVFKA